jgi:hypothetical protein
MSEVERIARILCDRNPDAQVTLWCPQMLPDRTRRTVMVEGATVPAWKLFEHKALAVIEGRE